VLRTDILAGDFGTPIGFHATKADAEQAAQSASKPVYSLKAGSYTVWLYDADAFTQNQGSVTLKLCKVGAYTATTTTTTTTTATTTTTSTTTTATTTTTVTTTAKPTLPGCLQGCGSNIPVNIYPDFTYFELKNSKCFNVVSNTAVTITFSFSYSYGYGSLYVYAANPAKTWLASSNADSHGGILTFSFNPVTLDTTQFVVEVFFDFSQSVCAITFLC
jgi:hypothetical protein